MLKTFQVLKKLLFYKILNNNFQKLFFRTLFENNYQTGP